MTAAIWWIRRDLRLADNQGLAAALAHFGQVIPVFVLDPVLLAAPDISEKRLAFLFGGLRELDADLRARGSRLILRQGDPLAELAALLNETSADIIYTEEDPWPYARRRDANVAAALPLRIVGGLTVHPLPAVRKDDGSPYTVFTPFGRCWKALPPPVRGDLIPTPRYLIPPPDVPSHPVPAKPALPGEVPFLPGEVEAQRRLEAFAEGPGAPIYRTATDRNRMDLDGTSRLSPYLRFGMISPRHVAVVAREAAVSAKDAAARRGVETWLNELIWRDFYMSILNHYPDVLNQAFRPNLRNITWDNDPSAFVAWCEGRTGYPAVDAAMRQLVQTGWMHNRARMIVASFLVKDLLVDWRWGERFFMQHLLDGDPAANNGGWQWTAGVGTDAAPYFRIFNPVLQGMKFDPAGDYVRRWVPELARAPNAYVHEPWHMPKTLQQEVDCIIGRDYPAPIVDHRWARERTLAAYRR